MLNKNKVFLGGTCGKSTWRDDVEKILKYEYIDYFNPIVEDWTPECIIEENRQKEDECDVHLYVITHELAGVYSIAEAVHSAHLEDKLCIFQIISDGFDKHQYKSLLATAELIDKIGGKVYISSNYDFNWIPLAISNY